ncbi:ABC transporter permease [Bradyrhizobium sp. Ec3.3]|uniref:ABC transporter permease n=1 Tax=Bradyrhizobium sp. Ec3.3 TaxID=189753 RepID=UPI000480D250|nr:ABC transporter permease [Bradyrhizobium sp. Ec3.3]
MRTGSLRMASQDLGVGLRSQVRVIGALMIREAMTRYGHKDLGFFWLMGEQLILTTGVIVMWSMGGLEHGHGGAGVVPMAVTGYGFIQLWRHIVGHSNQAIRHNNHLLYHQQVKILDILLANALLETIGTVSAFLIAYIPLWLFGVLYPIHDPLLLFGGFAFTGWLSFAVGLNIAAITELNEASSRLVAPILYITLPFTGLVFMVSWLPDQYQSIILWSPLINCVEMIRGGIFPLYMKTYFSPAYLTIVCVVLTAIGIPAVQYAQRHSHH